MRQRFAKNLGGTLRYSPPEARTLGNPTSGTVTLKTSLGSDLPTPVVGQAATLAGSALTFTLSTANTPDPQTWGYLYRAIWSYVIAGVTYQAEQLYEVNARILKPSLTAEDVERRLPAEWEELVADGDADVDARIADAWGDVLDDLAAKGFAPDRILDAERLVRPHRSRVIASLYRSFGPQWRETADLAEQQYGRDLDAAVAAVDWYDRDQSGTQDADEKRLVSTLRLSR